MLGKRKRAVSPSQTATERRHRPYTPESLPSPSLYHSTSTKSTTLPDPSALPLTSANLSLHDLAMSTSTQHSRKRLRGGSESPSKDKSINSEVRKLTLVNISNVKRDTSDLPPHVAELVNTIAQHRSDAPRSPRAAKIKKLRSAAALMKEDDGMDMLSPHVYLDPPQWSLDSAHTHNNIGVTRNHLLRDGFLPSIPPKFAQLGPLKTPKPDYCYGYLSHTIASALGEEHAPIPFESEVVARARCVEISATVPLPFLTVQYKSAAMGKSLREAEVQCLRDGAAIVRANHAICELAGETQTFQNPFTCHFSSCCDLETARLLVHFQDPLSIKLKTNEVFECRFKNDAEVDTWRQYMRGLHAWATGRRLQFFRQALESLDMDGTLGPGRYNDKDDASTTVTSSSVSASSISNASSEAGETATTGEAGVSDFTPRPARQAVVMVAETSTITALQFSPSQSGFEGENGITGDGKEPRKRMRQEVADDLGSYQRQ